MTRILWKFVRIRSVVGRFQRHFEQHYQHWRRIDFRSLQPPQLLALSRQMEDALLWNWQAPIINDFFVMVFYGILRKLCVQWCGDQSGALQNGLLCGTGGLESAQPAKLLLELARLASRHEELRQLIMQEPLPSLSQRVTEDPRFAAFRNLLDRYLDEYGLRLRRRIEAGNGDASRLPGTHLPDHPGLLEVGGPRPSSTSSSRPLVSGSAARRPNGPRMRPWPTREAGCHEPGCSAGSWLCAAGHPEPGEPALCQDQDLRDRRALFRSVGEQFARQGILDQMLRTCSI